MQKGSPMKQKIIAMLSSRIRFAERSRAKQVEKWQKAEELTLAFIQESEIDAIRRGDRDNTGTPRYTTLQIPYSYALIMAAHTYLTSVFFGRTPVHQFAGRHGETEMSVMAIEALIGHHVEIGKFLVPYYICKYGARQYVIGIINTYCHDDIINY